MIFEYGSMSSKFSCEADSKLTAYAAMICHYGNSSHMIAIYSPEECKKDQWLSITGKVSARIHEVFGGNPEDYPEKDAFDEYLKNHIDEINSCYNSIKQLV